MKRKKEYAMSCFLLSFLIHRLQRNDSIKGILRDLSSFERAVDLTM